MAATEDYCREIESYLCRKNDGHLIRIVGPAFEQVSSWAEEGIPLSVAFAGVDRYFERYYKKGPRRRPVRIEFCDADVRDAFDHWRRAVGVASRPDDQGSEPGSGRRPSLASHLERSLSRLTALRGSTNLTAAVTMQLEGIVRQLDGMQVSAKRARGEAREALLLELDQLDQQLLEVAASAVSDADRERLMIEANRELEPFRGRMLPESFSKAQAAAYARLVRERFRLPLLRYDG